MTEKGGGLYLLVVLFLGWFNDTRCLNAGLDLLYSKKHSISYSEIHRELIY